MPARLLTLPLQCGFHPALRITRIRVHRPRNSFPKGLPATAISISLTAFHDCLNLSSSTLDGPLRVGVG